MPPRRKKTKAAPKKRGKGQRRLKRIGAGGLHYPMRGNMGAGGPHYLYRDRELPVAAGTPKETPKEPEKPKAYDFSSARFSGVPMTYTFPKVSAPYYGPVAPGFEKAFTMGDPTTVSDLGGAGGLKSGAQVNKKRYKAKRSAQNQSAGEPQSWTTPGPAWTAEPAEDTTVPEGRPQSLFQIEGQMTEASVIADLEVPHIPTQQPVPNFDAVPEFQTPGAFTLPTIPEGPFVFNPPKSRWHRESPSEPAGLKLGDGGPLTFNASGPQFMLEDDGKELPMVRSKRKASEQISEAVPKKSKANPAEGFQFGAGGSLTFNASGPQFMLTDDGKELPSVKPKEMPVLQLPPSVVSQAEQINMEEIYQPVADVMVETVNPMFRGSGEIAERGFQFGTGGPLTFNASGPQFMLKDDGKELPAVRSKRKAPEEISETVTKKSKANPAEGFQFGTGGPLTFNASGPQFMLEDDGRELPTVQAPANLLGEVPRDFTSGKRKADEISKSERELTNVRISRPKSGKSKRMKKTTFDLPTVERLPGSATLAVNPLMPRNENLMYPTLPAHLQTGDVNRDMTFLGAANLDQDVFGEFVQYLPHGHPFFEEYGQLNQHFL